MSGSVHVAMVSEHASPLAVLGGVDAGGQNVHVAELSTHLAALGARVSVFTRRDDPRLPATVELSEGVSVVHVEAGAPRPIPKDELLPLMDPFGDELARSFAADPPDVVHAHFWMSGLASLLALGKLRGPRRPPLLQTFHALGVVKRRHQGEKDTSPPQRLAIEARILAEVDHVVATCTDEVFELLRMGADAGALTVVPCGVDTVHFSPDGPAEARDGPESRLLSVGRIVERKGIGNVITALAHLPGVELVVAGGPGAQAVGTDPEIRRLRRLAHDCGVGERVRFTGQVPREALPSLIRSVDAVVCVPWYEPFGIVPLEAMACGRPVVATAVGGLIDTVVEGVTGVHVPPRRPDLLARAVRDLLGDPERMAAMGSAGVERTRSRYTWERVAADTLAVYRSVIRQTSRRGHVLQRSSNDSRAQVGP